MPMKSIAAHFDGREIRLDEKVTLRPNTRLLVTILKDGVTVGIDYLAFASAAFADSYGDDEVEYTEADLK